MIKAILYDLDGVLVNACEWHYLALNNALLQVAGKRALISRTEHETVFNGLPTKRKLDILIQQGRLRDSDWKAIWELKQSLTLSTIGQHAEMDAEKVELHQENRAAGIVSACVTNSIEQTATLMLERTGQLPFMEFLISNEMVRKAKPHAEGYIRAMIRLNVMPEHTLIVEDSEKGQQAAEASGAHVLMVAGPHEVARRVRGYLREAVVA
jgi:beta-phosphoglucomutase-like phosphatase (HAD superfamily)